MATANNKKGASTKRASSASTSKNNTISTEERQQVLKLSSEALQLLFLAFSVLLLLGNFSLTGGFGRVVNGFLFGLFGTMEYFFPVLLFLGVSFYLANKGNARAMVRLAGIIILFFDLGIFFQLIFHNKYKSGVYSSLYGFGRDTHTGGGLICGGLYTGLSAIVGNVGTVIIFLALAIISIVLISGKSFIGGVKNSSKKVYANTVKAGNEYREKRRIRREERELERERERELMLERERELKSVDLNKGDMVLPHFDPAPEQAEPVAEVQLPGSNIAPGPVRASEAVSTPQAVNTPQTVISPETVVTPAAVIVPEPVEAPVNTSSLQFTNIKRREAPVEKDIYADEVIDEGRLIDRDIRKKQKYDEEHRIVLSDTEYNPYRGAARIGEEERPAPVHAGNDILIETGFKQNEAEDEFISPEMAAASDLAIEVTEMMADERASEQEELFSSELENRAAEEPVIIASNFEIVSEDEDVGADEHKIISFESRRRIAPSEDTEEDEETGADTDIGSIEDMRPGTEEAGKEPEECEEPVEPESFEEPELREELEERPAVKPMIAVAEDAPEPVKEAQAPPKPVEYKFPPVELLNEGSKETVDSRVELAETAEKLKSTLASFGINVEVTNISRGPAVTRYEIKIEQGVKVSRILSLSDDLKLNLAATDIRIEAPIPGKAAVGIEIPNKKTSTVMLRDIIDSEEFQNEKSRIGFVVGKDIAGQNVVANIDDMPHLLIAGATGSGKSVCVNTIIMSVLYKARPDEVKLVLIDPKRVELSMYNGLPHLMAPVVTDPGKAAGALHWGVTEMTRRFDLFEKMRVRDLKSYNAQVKKLHEEPHEPEYNEKGEEIPLPSPLPQVIIIVDEMADLMMVAKAEVETYICRLAQLARAAGIHLIIATQRPSVDVITGLIKANMPSRIAFMVSSGTDSRTILDANGAEKLLGKGDMLFAPRNYPRPERIQAPFVSDGEVQAVVDYIINENGVDSANKEDISEEIEAHAASSGSEENGSAQSGAQAAPGDERDDYFWEAGHFIIEKQKASIGILQRQFRIGFNRAARIMDQLADAGVVSHEDGTKARQILMDVQQFEELE